MVLRAVIAGMGTVGQAALRLASRRPGVEVVGVVTRDLTRQRIAGEILGSATNALVDGDLDAVMAACRPDVTLLATTSLLSETVPQLEVVLGHGSTALSTSEELAAPQRDRDAYRRLMAATSEARRAVVAVGVNPGLVFDSLPIWISSAAWDVRSIHVSRTLDASVFGDRVRQSLGIGFGRQVFEERLKSGLIRGHIGFPESAQVIARHFGCEVTCFSESVLPVMASDRGGQRKAVSVGVLQSARARIAGPVELWVTFDLRAHIDPASEGWDCADEIDIDGEHRMSWVSAPATHPVLATAGQLVNLAPAAHQLPGGLFTPTQVVGRGGNECVP